jgi:Tol biopolymer transport system component
MALETGARLGPYEIAGKLGAGGMGEVWKARDTRLGRTVAIKTSAEQFSARFEREARAVAALNHPNICQIYDVGPDYLVLEYVEGAPVQPTDQVRSLLDLAVQIADGLSAAHAAGFVHRDLKPSNVLVTREARVKILDFGLVKHVAQETHAPEPTLTGTGFFAGTTAYMSPEQMRGSNEIDGRSDQFSFGLLLYEMATGKHPFERATGAETMVAVMRDDAGPLPAEVPAPLRWIIERCLAKDPKHRYESTRDLFLELRSVRDHLADASTARAYAVIEPQPWRYWRFAAAFGAGALVVTAVGLLLGLRTPQPDADLRLRPLSFEGEQQQAAWSPDGRAVAYAAKVSRSEPWQLYVHYLDSPVATQITRLPDGATSPVFWTSTGRIVFGTPLAPAGLWSVSSVGGEPEPFFAIDANSTPSVAPDGSAVAFLRQGDDGAMGVWISSPPGAAAERYVPAPFATRTILNRPVLSFSPDGRQLLLSWNPGGGEENWLLPFPPDEAKPPRRVLRGIPTSNDWFRFSWMPDNRRVVASATDGTTVPRLFIADVESGRFRALSSGTTPQILPAVSPSGDKLAFVEDRGDFDVVTLDLETAAVTPLIDTYSLETTPAWHAQRPLLVYVTDRNAASEIWLHEPGELDRPLVRARDFPIGGTHWLTRPELSPDASRVIYLRGTTSMWRIGYAGPDSELWVSAVAGGAPQRLVSGGPVLHPGTWSPDGRWYVYVALAESGLPALMKVRTTLQAAPEVVRPDIRPGPVGPVWSPAGDWILYADRQLKLTSPDGATVRDLGENFCAFARDGERLYCLSAPQSDGSANLVSMNLAGEDIQTIGTLPAEQLPFSALQQGGRLTLTPDGTGMTYSVMEPGFNLWLMEGLDTVPPP